MTKFLSIGHKIGVYMGLKSSNSSVKFNKKGITELCEINPNLRGLFQNMFEEHTCPSVEFVAKGKSTNKVSKMIVRDGDEIISETYFVFPKNKNIFDVFPEVNGKLKKIVLNKDEISKITEDNNELSDYLYALINGKPTTAAEERFINYIDQNVVSNEKNLFIDRFLDRIENPILELSEKRVDGGKICALILKDGDRIVAQGAYSNIVDKSGKIIRKYHFSSDSTTSTGHSVNERAKSRYIDKLAYKIKQAFDVVGKYVISGRSHLMLELKYGLNGEKPKTNKEIGYMFGLTAERVGLIINRAKTKLLAQNIDDKKLKIYKMTKTPPKYLNEEEKELFMSAKGHAILGDKDALDQLDILFKLNDLRARKAAYNAIHDIKPREN